MQDKTKRDLWDKLNETYKEFDLHGHTWYSAYPEFLSYGPAEAIQIAREVGLDGIAITGHDTIALRFFLIVFVFISEITIISVRQKLNFTTIIA